MKRRVSLAFSLCLAAGLILPGASGISVIAAETEAVSEADGETDPEAASLTESGVSSEDAGFDENEAVTEGRSRHIGELVFAQCDDFINIRSEASTEGEITAKIYNDCAAIIIGEEDGWFQIASGNAVGYAKAEFFATGEEAEAIAEETACNVATVQAEYLNIRSEASMESDVIDVLKEDDEIEVVLSEDDEWLKVALSDDSYGYIKAEYVDCDVYYPTAETLEEEEDRLAEEAREAAAAETEDITSEAEAEEVNEAESSAEIYTETEATQAETYAEPEVYPETYVPEVTVQTETYVPAETVQSETSVQTEAAQTEASVQTEAAQTEAPVQTEAVIQTEAVQTEASAVTETAQAEVMTYSTAAAVQTEEVSYETYEEPAQTDESVQSEAAVSEAADVKDDSSASLGQSIANYAVQFIGNPYVYGGTSLTNGADCSGFVQSVFSHFGISLARTADAQALCGTEVSSSDAQPGDLFFYSSEGGYIDHVAIYIGGGAIVHASNSARGIVTDNAFYSTPVCVVRCY